MADTYTTNLNLTKPEPGAAEDTWGISLNADLDALDAIFSSSGTQVNLNPNQVNFADNKKAVFGAGSDLQIYHNGTHSYISDNGTGDLYLQGSSAIRLTDPTQSENFAVFNHNGAVNLYHDSSLKFQTTSTGINVIGTVTSDGLTVDGDITISDATPTITFTDTDNNYDATIAGLSGSLVLKADSGAEFGTETIQFHTGGSQRATINSSGQLGIGTTLQKTNLDVVRGGTTGLSAVNARTVALFQNNSSAGSVISVNAPNTGYSGIFLGDPENEAQGQIKMVHTDNTMQFTASGSTSAMTINSSGSVGIGTTSPNYPLTVHSTGDGIKFEVSDTVDANFRIQVSGNDIKTGPSTASDYIFQTGNTERARINSSGSLLVGRTASTSAKLHLEQATSVHMDMNSVGDNRGKIGSKVNDLYIGHSSGSARIYFKNNVNSDGHPADSGDTKMVITDSGVGIGTASPGTGYKLDITGLSGYDDILRLTAVGTNIGARINLTNTGTGVARINATNNSLALQTAGIERMRINSGGDLLLGTTSGTAVKLNVQSSKANGLAAELANTQSSTGSGIVVKGGSSSSNYSADFRNYNNSSLMRIRGDGRVGISTTSPRVALDVNGEVAIAYNATYGLRFYNQPNNNWSSIGNTETSSAANLVFKDSTGEVMRIASGKVGIGTSSLSHPLNVVNSGELQAEFSGYSHASSANNSRAGSGSIRLGSGVGTTGLLIDYTDQGQTVGLIKNEYVASGSSELRLQSPFLSFYTGTSAAERARIDSSGRLGIGTTSPNRTLNLHVAANDSNFTQFTNSTTGEVGSNGFLVGIGSAGNAELWNYEAQPIIFATSSSERARIDSSGNFLVGTTSYNNDIAGIGFGSGNFLYATRSSNVAASFGRLSNDGDIIDFRKDAAIVGSIGASGGDLYLDTSGGELSIRINGTTKYEFDSSQFYSKTDGQTSLGVSSNRFNNLHLSGIVNPSAVTSFINPYHATVANGAFVYVSSSGSITVGVPTGASRVPMSFRNPHGEVGTITTSGLATSYNTSSDYRLKENVDYDFNALERVAQLKPARFNFIADADTIVDGFLAHEVSDIVPEAIYGEKDAVDDEGNPEYQGIDQSKLVPLLTKAIQEQQTQIEALQSEINLLKGE